MRAFVLLLVAAFAAALPQPQHGGASGHSSAQVSATSQQQTGADVQASLDSLTDAELLSALTGGVPPDQPPTKIIDPVPSPTPTPTPVPELTDAELQALLGVGANQGETVRCSESQHLCVPYYQCHQDEIITDGAGLIDIRFGSKANESDPLSHSECPSYIDVCCRDTTIKPEPIEPEPYVPRCGRRNVFGVNARITGFTEGESQFGEFPWTAAVLRVETVGGEEKNLFVCGGALVHPQVVLTAAHCVATQADPAALRVRLGEWDTQHTTEFYPHEDVPVAKVVVRKDFNGRNLHNDMALLFLEREVQLQEHIDTLCLPDPGVNYDGAECVATGWGKDRFDSGQYQTVLKQVELTRVSHGYCQTQLRTTRLGQRFVLDDSFTCAGAPEPAPGAAGEVQAAQEGAKSAPVADTCTGDGGSPLACRDPADPERYVHGGVVAWGIGCGEKGIPGVYADPQKFVYWIDENISSYFKLDKSYYGFQKPATQQAAVQP